MINGEFVAADARGASDNAPMGLSAGVQSLTFPKDGSLTDASEHSIPPVGASGSTVHAGRTPINSGTSNDETDRLTTAMSALEVLAIGDEKTLCRPCVDCGLRTGNFCDGVNSSECFATVRVPTERWAPRQRTPLCTRCDWSAKACHYCRKVHFCTPPERLLTSV